VVPGITSLFHPQISHGNFDGTWLELPDYEKSGYVFRNSLQNPWAPESDVKCPATKFSEDWKGGRVL
jgi:hypothetical protein